MNQNSKQYRLLSVFLVMVLFLSLLPLHPAFALNGAGNKAYNFQGYRYLDANHIQIWMDKSTGSTTDLGIPNIDKAKFKIFQGVGINGPAVNIESAAAGTGSNLPSGTGLSSGGSVVLTTTDAFVSGQTYTVVVNNGIRANNGLTLGSFHLKNDVTFSFTAPSNAGIDNSAGTYVTDSTQGVLASDPLNNANNVQWEGNIGFTLNAPAANFADVKNGLVLKKFNGTDWVSLILDSTIDGSPNGDIYAPVVSTDHTFFFFPMTGGGGAYSYNLVPGTDYELDIPAITLINGQTIEAQTIKFRTNTDDVPATPGVPTAVPSGSNLSLSWAAATGAKEYNVYASQDPFWGYVKINKEPITTTEFKTSGLIPLTSYYFRVTTVNVADESGYSLGVQSTTPAPPAATVESAATTDATHLVLAMDSVCPLIGSQADPNAFSISGAASNPAVTNVSVDGTRITLTLSSEIVHGELITVNYTKTGTNNVTNGTEVDNFTGQAVANKVPGSNPALTSAVTSSDGSKVILTFEKAMNDPAGKEAQFIVHAGAGTDAVTTAARNAADSKVIELLLKSKVTNGQQVTLDYAAGTLTAQDDGVLLSFSGIMVTNKTAPSIPTINTVMDHTTVVFGKTEVNALVKLYIDGKYQQKETAKYGTYKFVIHKQKAGTEIKVTATAYNVSSAPRIIKVIDKTAPVIPTIKTVSDHSRVVSGKTEAYAKVKWYISGKYKGKKTADKYGVFKFTISKQKPGIQIKITAADKVGNISSRIVKVADKTAPGTASVHKVTHRSKHLTGHAEKGATVYVYKGKKYLGKAVVNSHGYFSVKMKKQGMGTKLSVYVKDKAGNKSKKKSVRVY